MSCNSANWKGFLKVGGYTLPYNSCSVNVLSEFINGQPISAPISAYARSLKTYSVGKKHVESSIQFDVFATGGYGNACQSLLKGVLSNCGTISGEGGTGSLIFCPSGGSNFTVPGPSGKAVVSSLTIKGNNKGLVQASVNLLATSVGDGTGGSADLQFETAGLVEDSSPLPWYNSSFAVSGAGDDSLMSNYLIDWELTINNNAELIYGFCNSDDLSDITLARDIRLGLLDVEGSFKYYSPTGIYTPELRNGASIIIDLVFFTFTMPHVVFRNDGIPSSSGDALVVRNVQYKAYASEGSAAIY
jgi:hypothetical protein